MKEDEIRKLLGAQAQKTLSESFAKAVQQLPPLYPSPADDAANWGRFNQLKPPSPLNFPDLTAPREELVKPRLDIQETPTGLKVIIPPAYISRYGVDFGAKAREEVEVLLTRMILRKTVFTTTTDLVTDSIHLTAEIKL